MKHLLIFACIGLLLFSCGNDPIPKPKSYLKLEYPVNSYKKMDLQKAYSFEVSKYTQVNTRDNGWAKIEYPELKATIHITYRPVDNNLNEILKEVEKLTFEHTIKADAINSVPYENFKKKVYGKLYNVEGDVATNLQFRVTDSVNHVLSGALYFYVKPNYDSILPAINYIEKDIKHLVETLEWK
ncbi:gliding motility lipoprotein GldD [Lutibacter oricola]|nr:gliding motility lipoprotein GldD [Lutibacter oricola]